MSAVPIGEILKLSPKDRLAMMEAIWDSLAAEPLSVPVPSSHIKELKRRAAQYEADPEGSTVPWEEVKQEARKKLGG